MDGSSGGFCEVIPKNYKQSNIIKRKQKRNLGRHNKKREMKKERKYICLMNRE
jgi:hypothetical protein